ncbi:BTAD domain-containing putative transcriptional regulator [Agromyces bauzanensis]
MITLSVFGPLRCESNGIEVAIGGPRSRGVLARLIVEHGRDVSRDRLIDDVWGEGAPAKALASLQVYVSRLRSILSDLEDRPSTSALPGSPAGYRLSMPIESVDVWQFEAAVAAAEASAHSSSDRVKLLQPMIERWRGPAYPEFSHLLWASREAHRLEQLRSEAIELFGDALIRLGRNSEAARWLESLVEGEPLRESAWAALAVALYRSDRQAEALEAVRRARAELRASAGLDLGEELSALESDLLAHDIRNPRWRSEIRASVRASVTDAFVGRSDALALVNAESRIAAGGRGRVCVVEGVAGSGKSRLAVESVARLESEGWTGAYGRCIADAGLPSGHAWLSVLDSLDDRPESPSHDDHPGSTFADDPIMQRFRRHRRISDRLRSVATASPLALIVDDLQNADEDTLLILERVIHDLADQPVLLIGTIRVGEPNPPGLQPTLDSASAVRIRLDGLTADESALMVRNLTDRTLDGRDAEAVHARTAGNPFYIRHLASLLSVGSVAEGLVRLPDAVGEVVRDRISHLAPPTRDLLPILAVAGNPIDVGLLPGLLGCSESEAMDAAETGLAAGLLIADSRSISFAHDLVREAITAGLAPFRQSALHDQLARALQRSRPDDHDAIAFHLVRSGRLDVVDEVARHSRLAAEAEEARYSFAAAARLWQQVAESIPRDEPSRRPERVDAQVKVIRASALAGDAAQARELRSAVLGELGPETDAATVSRIIVAYDVPTLWLNQEYGRVDRSLIDRIESCLAVEPLDPRLRCRLLCCLSLELEWSSSSRGLAAAEQALGLARSFGESGLLVTAIGCVFRHSYEPGQLEYRQSLADKALAVARRGAAVPVQLLALLMSAECACAHGRLTDAEAYYDEIRRISVRYQMRSPLAITQWNVGMRLLCAGRFEEARAAYSDAAELSRASRVWDEDEAWQLATSVCLAMHEGRMSEVVDVARVTAEHWPGPGREALAYALHAAGDAAGARRIDSVDPPLDAGRLVAVTWRALAGLALDDDARIRWAYPALLPYADEVAAGDTTVIAHGPVAQILGELASRLGRTDTARGHFRHALTVADRAGSQYWADHAWAAMQNLT